MQAILHETHIKLHIHFCCLRSLKITN